MKTITVPVAEFAHDFASVRLGWGTQPKVAYADGRTDDTAAIQAAIDETIEAGGGTVHVPPGVYSIRGVLEVPDVVDFS